jgi:hypothetical protein
MPFLCRGVDYTMVQPATCQLTFTPLYEIAPPRHGMPARPSGRGSWGG